MCEAWSEEVRGTIVGQECCDERRWMTLDPVFAQKAKGESLNDPRLFPGIKREETPQERQGWSSGSSFAAIKALRSGADFLRKSWSTGQVLMNSSRPLPAGRPWNCCCRWQMGRACRSTMLLGM